MSDGKFQTSIMREEISHKDQQVKPRLIKLQNIQSCLSLLDLFHLCRCVAWLGCCAGCGSRGGNFLESVKVRVSQNARWSSQYSSNVRSDCWGWWRKRRKRYLLIRTESDVSRHFCHDKEYWYAPIEPPKKNLCTRALLSKRCEINK
jgi:hypothetical protein